MKTRILILGCLMIFVINQNYGQNASMIRKYVETDSTNADYLDNYVFIKMNDNSFSAVYFSANSISSSIDYLKGNFENNMAKCNILGCVEDVPEAGEYNVVKTDCDGPINLYLKNNKSVLMIDPYGDKLELKQGTVYLNLVEIRNIRELPLVTAKVITKIDFAKAKVELLDIGDFEKIGKFISFWYKVNVNGVVGWVYGG